jgi:hypothetical protein
MPSTKPIIFKTSQLLGISQPAKLLRKAERGD